MKITVLTENTSNISGISSEHGLSLFIETNSRTILFDMGQTNLFAENADKLGLDISCVDIAILSHGHYDHGGGLSKFLELNKKAPVYISANAFKPYYHGCEKYIGLDVSLVNNSRFIYTEDFTNLGYGINLYSCNEMERYYDLGSFGLTEFKDGEYIPDKFLHEQYLLVEENGKRILISGCSHKGILNIAKWFKPDILVGGFHFSGLPLDDTLDKYSKILASYDTDFYTCHCTGTVQYEFMKERIPGLRYLSCGESIVI